MIAYELFAGHYPVDTRSMKLLLLSVFHDTPDLTRLAIPDVPEGIVGGPSHTHRAAAPGNGSGYGAKLSWKRRWGQVSPWPLRWWWERYWWTGGLCTVEVRISTPTGPWVSLTALLDPPFLGLRVV